MTLSGNPTDYLVSFIGGVLMSFSPCVFPLLPVTAGFIGAKSAGSRLKGFSLSLVYVTGIAVTYSILGLIASLTGKLFGVISAHPLTYLVVGLIVIVFGISMLDIFTIRIPQFIRLPQPKRQNYFSTFFLGLTSGLIIGPCLTPVLGAILTYLAAGKSIAYGMTLLFSFAYGMGILLIIAGTFSSILANLPRSGKWMLYIKKICGLILVGAGLYFIYIAVERWK